MLRRRCNVVCWVVTYIVVVVGVGVVTFAVVTFAVVFFVVFSFVVVVAVVASFALSVLLNSFIISFKSSIYLNCASTAFA